MQPLPVQSGAEKQPFPNLSAVWDMLFMISTDGFAVKVIAAHFPEVMEGEKVNKRKLRNLVFGDNARLKVLESLIHPFLKQTLMNVRRRNARRADLFFMDVALLFEMGWDKYCDYIVVADVDYETQKMRVMRRDNISAADFDKINRIQMDNAAKKVLADVIINTDKPINLLKVELLAMIEEIEGC